MTGPGVRRTLEILGRLVPLELHEVPTGTQVLDWTVPREWQIRDAYVKRPDRQRVIDFKRSNLHVVHYSVPVRARMSLTELRPHLHTLPDHPDWVPYRTSYWTEDWGFCLSHSQLERLEEVPYEVCIDSTLAEGALSYGELFVPGESRDEVLFSCHICHPSLANDNLSGMVVAAYLARHISERPRRLSYRFLFIPATIGAITWLARNEACLVRIKHGLVLALLGHSDPVTYKRSRRGNTPIDAAVAHVLALRDQPYQIVGFEPYGHDERQFCSPGFNLPIGCLMRAPHGQFPEYHSSADNLDLVRPENLADSWAVCAEVIDVLENNRSYLNLCPKGEPQLGRRRLYRSLGGAMDRQALERDLLWVLNLSDGVHDLLSIAQQAGRPFTAIQQAADLLLQHELLRLLTDESAAQTERCTP
jgi:aminopeptidase-like protein